MLATVYGALALPIVTIDNVDMSFFWRATVLGVLLIWLSIIDLEKFRLPDWLTLPLAVIGCLTPTVHNWPTVIERIVATVIGFLSLFIVARCFRRYRGYAGLGLGDAKLFAAAGGWLGIAGLPIVLLGASTLALVAAGVAHFVGAGIDRRTRLPFGPFLGVAIWVVWLTGLPAWMT